MRIRSNLQAHDADVMNAMAKGRTSDWADALSYLGEASAWLGQAQTARAALGDAADVLAASTSAQ